MWRVYYHLSMTVILNQTEQLQDTNNHPFQIQNKPYNKGMKIQLENELDRPLLASNVITQRLQLKKTLIR